jgi:hypothetical protein
MGYLALWLTIIIPVSPKRRKSKENVFESTNEFVFFTLLWISRSDLCYVQNVYSVHPINNLVNLHTLYLRKYR